MSTYLYLDDAELKDVETFANALCTAADELGLQLKIEIRKPPASLRIADLLTEVSPDGILVDVELEKAVDEAQRPYPITGTALSQNVRDLQNAERVAEMPLVRFSQDDIIRKYVGKDQTSLDLFDRYFDKAQVRREARLFAETLVALDRGYKTIVAAKPIERARMPDLLGVTEDFLGRLNSSLTLGFLDHEGAPAHDFARFVSSALIYRDGPLICEKTLAARLGIDPGKSPAAWAALLEHLKPTQYAGIFAVANDKRWWADMVADWWAERDSAHRMMINATSEERRATLAEQLALPDLAPIADDPDSPGPYFWTICVTSGKPVDPMNAYAITADKAQREWHDIQYMCREEAFQHARDPRFDAAERARILDDRG